MYYDNYNPDEAYTKPNKGRYAKDEKEKRQQAVTGKPE